MLVSETRSDSNTVGTYLVVILFARVIGYSLLGSKDVRLTEVYAVASSKRYARSITQRMSTSERAWNIAVAEANKKMTSASRNK